MATLIDTNVILDLLNEHEVFTPWSERKVHDARLEDMLCINQIILAETSPGFSSVEDMNYALSPSDFIRENLPWEAARLAGKAFVQYRRKGGEKRSPLPDFYIGAHAMVRGHTILTRDPTRYRSYFPLVDIIAPDTHP